MSGRRWDPAVLATLRAVPELGRFSDRQLRALLPYVDEVKVESGRRLATADQVCREFLMIVDGSVEASDAAGSRQLAAGDSSDWAAMWERGRSPATLTTTSQTRLLVLGRGQFRAVTALAVGNGRAPRRFASGTDRDGAQSLTGARDGASPPRTDAGA